MKVTLELTPKQIRTLADALAVYADDMRDGSRSVPFADRKATEALDMLQQLAANANDPVVPVETREQRLEAALEPLVKLHHNWYRGSASITVRFEKMNDELIAAAKKALKS